MVADDLDRNDIAELIENLAPDDQRELVREVSGMLRGDDDEAESAVLTEDVLGAARDRFLEEMLSEDYEALGKQLTLALLTGARRELGGYDEAVERVELDLEAWIEPVHPVPGHEDCFRLCIVNGILEPVCWEICIVDGIYD